MAAFVGNHDCVAIINNYVPKEDILYFTRKQPFEEEPKLSPELAKPLHDIVMMMNTHPVRWGFLTMFCVPPSHVRVQSSSEVS